MKTNITYRYPVAFTIAGSDSGGGAGIQADLKTFSALGVYGTSAITAITAQNTEGIRGIQSVSPEILQRQIDAVFEDMTIDAVKIGMLQNKVAAQIVSKAIDHFSPPYIILDPVMISTSGSKLMDDDAIDMLVNELFHQATLITPNVDEAEYISGVAISSEEDMEKAGYKLLELGCHAVLIKGGHLKGDMTTDLLISKSHSPLRLTTKTIETINTHGTGCTLSSAIAAYLALGKKLPDAVRFGKNYITKALSSGRDVTMGYGQGPMNHFFDPVPLSKIKTNQV